MMYSDQARAGVRIGFVYVRVPLRGVCTTIINNTAVGKFGFRV